MTHVVLGLLLRLHLAIVPLFFPKLSGIHNGQLTVSAAPRWQHIIQTGALEQPDGAMIFWRTHFG